MHVCVPVCHSTGVEVWRGREEGRGREGEPISSLSSELLVDKLISHMPAFPSHMK